jgi:hypothetical protein
MFIENSIISWSESISALSFIDQFTIFDARSIVENVKSMMKFEFSRINVYSFDILINSQLNLFNHSISEFGRIDDEIREFHHWWWALKFSHIIEFFVNSIDVNFLSIVYLSESVFWFFSLYTFKIVRFSMFVSKMLNIWMFVFEQRSDRDMIKNWNDFDTKIIILCLLFSFYFWSSNILLNVE